ncbi:MAG: branched-chain amino acid ABC transporter permease [Nitrospinota bacterium]
MSSGALLDVALTGVVMGGIYALIAVGLNLQYGLMRILNVSHGEAVMVGAYLTHWLYTSYGINPFLSLLVTLPVIFLMGLGFHRLLFGRLIKRAGSGEALESDSLVISFGLIFILQNVVFLIWGGEIKGYSYLNVSVELGGSLYAANRLVAFAVAAALCLGFYGFLRLAATGRALRALMQDRMGAELIGIKVGRFHALCFGLGLAMAGITGSLLSMVFELTPDMGLSYTVTALIIIILGGLGNILGSLVGAVILGLLEVMGERLLGPDMKTIIMYVAFMAILLIRPRGLLGTKG